MVTGKCCSACGETKPPGDFYRRARSRDGLLSRCKACHKQQVAERTATTTPLEGDGPVACACGCGQPTNAARDEAIRLWQKLGTHKAVARRLGVTRQRVSQLINSTPPRFIAGHNGKSPSAPKTCKHCKRSFIGWPRQGYCLRRACRAKADEIQSEWHNEHALSLDDGEEWRVNPSHHSLIGLSPFEELARADVDRILGDLAIEDVSRLRDHELERLRRDLLEAGVIPRSVQRQERERLSEPKRRGSAPPPARTRMSTKRKHRKPGHLKSAGSKRGSRKPQKRWGREAA